MSYAQESKNLQLKLTDELKAAKAKMEAEVEQMKAKTTELEKLMTVVYTVVLHYKNVFSKGIERLVHEDITSPYFLSNIDHPRLVLTSPPLTGKNFQAWRCDFKISIGAKNKTTFLTGALPQLGPDDPLLNSWLRCNQIVMSWILHSVSEEIKSNTMYLDSATAMWSELNHIFDQGNGPRIFGMNETLITLHQGHDSVSAYFTKLKVIWDEIVELHPRTPCTCAALADSLTFHNQYQVLQFLTSLNEYFHAVRAQILLIDPFPCLPILFSMVAQEERQ
ncbi:uncharacterized protein LOC133814839 [Humulus lupulus]|uniref:uncharacterized protein LOC133814839 n=1 Tax=Humulus lupulus TaxID=3486 RepID=UPI002B40B1BB|nr:uncharacterized protein LOC133814839 [Humulus lupulus]